MGKNRIMIYGPKMDGTYVVELNVRHEEPIGHSLLEVPRTLGAASKKAPTSGVQLPFEENPTRHE